MFCGSCKARARGGGHVAFDAILRTNLYVVPHAANYFDFLAALEFGFDAARAERIIHRDLFLARNAPNGGGIGGRRRGKQKNRSYPSEDQGESRATNHLALPVPLARKSSSQPNAFGDASNRPIRRGKDRWSWLSPKAANRATTKSSAQEKLQQRLARLAPGR